MENKNQIRWKIMYKPERLKEENNMKKIYELTPTTGYQQSFYGKAKVVVEDDGTETLYIYKDASR